MTDAVRGAATAPPDEPLVDPAFAPVAKLFDRIYRSPRDGGYGLVVRVRGRKVVDLWKGFADAHGERPWTHDTGAICCSATKGVTATVIHRLADRGLLDYDEPVTAYWPEFAAGGKGPTGLADRRTTASPSAGCSPGSPAASPGRAWPTWFVPSSQNPRHR